MSSPADSIRAVWLAVRGLIKFRIALAVTITAVCGYLIAEPFQVWSGVLPLLGVFVLAAGASALNEVQEAAIDARMARTMSRPIPSGRIRRSTAAFWAGLLILLGLYCLASGPRQSGLLVGLGLFSVFWYNGVYTLLKRVTAYAVVPGALVGAIPPVIGWVAADGYIYDSLILLIAGFFFMWQIPHFWLLVLLHGEEYAAAGLPTLTQRFSRAQLVRITYVWTLATLVFGMTFPALIPGSVALPWSVLVVAAGVWIALSSVDLVRLGTKRDVPHLYRQTFLRINLYVLLVIISLTLTATGLHLG